MNKKVGIWIVLILTSLALVIPSIAIMYNLFFAESAVSTSQVINPEDFKVSIETANPTVGAIPSDDVSLSTQESPR